MLISSLYLIPNIKKYLKDINSQISIGGGIFFIIFSLYVFFSNFKFSDQNLILHFNLRSEIDFVGSGGEIFFFLILFFVLFLINQFISFFLYFREKFLSYIINYFSLWLIALAFFSILYISSLN